jgi:hypothetical protein
MMAELIAQLQALFGQKYRVFVQYALKFMPYEAEVILVPKSGPNEPAPAPVLPPGALPVAADE